MHQVRRRSGNSLSTCRMFHARSQILCVRKHKAVKFNAKIMDSGISGIQMWRELKKKERQEKRRANYEKNREKINEMVVD